MTRDMDQFDTLLQRFRALERTVRQRRCRHRGAIEITAMGDAAPRYLCTHCGRQRVMRHEDETSMADREG